MNTAIYPLTITCPAFEKDGFIPNQHTGFGVDISPEIIIRGLTNNVKSLAIIMDDIDFPILKEYNHWVLWNLLPMSRITENLPYGVVSKYGAVQGRGFGKNRYRGPKPLSIIRTTHRYRFRVYALDCFLDLPFNAKKKALLSAMEGHILQIGETVGWYKRELQSEK